MSSHRFNMYAGAVIGSLLVFLLLNFFSDLIYRGPGHAGEEPLAFAVAVEESAGEASAAAEVDLTALVAAADPAQGEKVFGKCKSCHQVAEGANGVGPSLWGVVGRDVASATGYSYSAALGTVEGSWDLEKLSAFLESPKTFAPGTKMSFAGLPKAGDRVNVIAYLNEADGSPVELAAAPAATDAATMPAAPAATAEPAPAAVAPAQPATSTETATATTEAAPAATTETAPAAPAAVAAASGAGDAAAGEKVFRKCKACHKVEEGKNGVGPSLWGVVGRPVASIADFGYSDAMKARGGEWDFTSLEAYLTNPKGVVPGTKMTFPGLKDAKDRLDVITYLNEADGTPEPLQ